MTRKRICRERKVSWIPQPDAGTKNLNLLDVSKCACVCARMLVRVNVLYVQSLSICCYVHHNTNMTDVIFVESLSFNCLEKHWKLLPPSTPTHLDEIDGKVKKNWLMVSLIFNKIARNLNYSQRLILTACQLGMSTKVAVRAAYIDSCRIQITFK